MKNPAEDDSDYRSDLERKISTKEKRKLQARQDEHRTVWFGLGTFGLVGWSVTIPALFGIALGIWIDTRLPSRFSWTLMLMVLGVALGCLNAWHWVVRESQDQDKQQSEQRTEHLSEQRDDRTP